jgi:hypothetical protein
LGDPPEADERGSENDYARHEQNERREQRRVELKIHYPERGWN